MKRIISIKPLLAIVTILLFAIVFKSCKKGDNEGARIEKNAEAVKAAAIAEIKAKYGNISGSEVIPVNKDAKDVFYRDANGTMVKLGDGTALPAPPGGGSNCIYNCNNTTNPNNLRQIYNLYYVQRNYICESGVQKSDLIANWKISVPYTPLATFNGNLSTGEIKVTSPTGAVLTFGSTPNTPLDIRNMGADPKCVANTLYEINFRIGPAGAIPDDYFGLGMLIDVSLSLYNDCSLLGNLVNIGYTQAPDYSLTSHIPCYRIDKVYFSFPGQPGNTPTVAVGNYAAICTHPAGFVLIDAHQLEYRKVNSPTSLEWGPQTSPVYGNMPFGSTTQLQTLGTYAAGNLINMQYGTGQWLIRYRNIKTGNCNKIDGPGVGPGGVSGGNGNWGLTQFWITELVNL